MAGRRAAIEKSAVDALENEIVEGSGNVFEDLGFEEPEEELLKAQLALWIHQTITQRRLTQAAAAKIMGIDQPKVSAIVNYRTDNFSVGRLFRLLALLGRDIHVSIGEPSGKAGRGQLRFTP
jgi:predicted XRE-type DNA-binding protein